jgi:response regulator of citrate/malate metabolism
MKAINTIIVEDDPQIAEIQSRFIARIEGFEVKGIANTLEEATDLIEVFKPELVLLDIYFAEGNGLDFMWKVRQQTRSIDFILITAAKEANTLQEAIRGGAYDYILKPMSFNRFQSALNNFKTFKNKFNDVGELEQNVVDELLHSGTNEDQSKQLVRMPKNIDQITTQKVEEAINNHNAKSISAEELGQMIGMSRTTARRYLEYLASVNVVTPNLVYGSVGRPERQYFRNKK